MTLVGLLPAQVDMHDAGAGVERGFCLARHLLGRDRHVVLFWVGQYAIQRTGNDGLVAHGSAFRGLAKIAYAIMRAGSGRFLRPPAIGAACTIAAVDREIPRAGKDRPRLQAVEAADRVTEM